MMIDIEYVCVCVCVWQSVAVILRCSSVIKMTENCAYATLHVNTAAIKRRSARFYDHQHHQCHTR